MSRWVVLFAKAPRLGTVKTRLESDLSVQQVAELYTLFIKDSAELLTKIAVENRIIAFDPADSENELKRLIDPIGSFDYIAQDEGDLGDRLHQIFSKLFSSGADQVVVVGTDTPNLPVSHIDDAFRMLCKQDIVIGPSTDGGYYLIGARVNPHKLFEGISWSSEVVLDQTLKRLGKQTLGILPPWYDIDMIQDARFLRSHLRAMSRARQCISRRCLEYLEKLEI